MLPCPPLITECLQTMNYGYMRIRILRNLLISWHKQSYWCHFIDWKCLSCSAKTVMKVSTKVLVKLQNIVHFKVFHVPYDFSSRTYASEYFKTKVKVIEALYSTFVWNLYIWHCFEWWRMWRWAMLKRQEIQG